MGSVRICPDKLADFAMVMLDQDSGVRKQNHGAGPNPKNGWIGR